MESLINFFIFVHDETNEFFKSMKIECFQGDDEKLYQKVARLVMDPTILKENNNYPFKTSENYRWFVASAKGNVVGFMPVELRNNSMILNNYYVYGGNEQVLDSLIKAVIQANEEALNLEAVVLSRDIDVFQRNNFDIIRRWKLYVKMKWQDQK